MSDVHVSIYDPRNTGEPEPVAQRQPEPAGANAHQGTSKGEEIRWRPIPSAPGYFVASDGCIGSMKPYRRNAPVPQAPRKLLAKLDKDGYRTHVLYISGKRASIRACRVVCEVFNGAPKPGQVVRHLDGSKTNDSPENLVWGTPKENSADMETHGTRLKGSAINTSRLTAEQVQFIRCSDRGHSDLAREFGVTPTAIWFIRAGRVWKHV